MHDIRVCVSYLDGSDMERGGDPEDGHDDSLVFLIDEDLHISNVFLSRHLRAVLVGDIGLSGPRGQRHREILHLKSFNSFGTTTHFWKVHLHKNGESEIINNLIEIIH